MVGPPSLGRFSTGSVLLEALFAMVILLFGIMGLLRLISSSANVQSDAEYSLKAAMFATNMVNMANGLITTGGDHLSSLLGDLDTQNWSGGAPAPGTVLPCLFPAAHPKNIAMQQIIATLMRYGLPGTDATRVSVRVSALGADMGRMDVIICWASPKSFVSRELLSGYSRYHFTGQLLVNPIQLMIDYP